MLIRVPDFNWLLYEKATTPYKEIYTKASRLLPCTQPEVTMARLKHEAGGRGRQKRRESARGKEKKMSIAEVLLSMQNADGKETNSFQEIPEGLKLSLVTPRKQVGTSS